MKKNKIPTPSLVSLFILTAVTSILWVFISIYKVLTTEPSPNVPANITEALNPALDKNALNKLDKRVYIEESQLQQIQPEVTSSPSPSPSPEEVTLPEATESGELNI